MQNDISHQLAAKMLERSYGVASRIHAAILMRGNRMRLMTSERRDCGKIDTSNRIKPDGSTTSIESQLTVRKDLAL